MEFGLGKEKQYRDLELVAYIDEYHPSRQSYSKIGGSERHITMAGYVDDPAQGPLGDIWEGVRNSDFSWAPISIKISLDSGDEQNIGSQFGETALGSIAIRKNVEVKKFEVGGEEYVSHPLRVWLSLPLESFIAVEETLKTNAHNGKQGQVILKARVARNQVMKDDANWEDKYLYDVRVGDLDVSKKGLEMGVFKFSLGSTIINNVDRTVERVKTLSFEGSSSLSIVMKKYHWSFDTETGSYNRIHIDGIANKKPSEKVDVFIELHEFKYFSDGMLDDDLPVESIYGTYSYLQGNGLHIDLAYHPRDFDDQIKPLLCSGGSQSVWFTVQFDGMLNFDADQRGKVRKFSLDALYEQPVQNNYEQDLIEKLANIENKISDVEAKICEGEIKNKHKIDFLFENIAAIKRQTDGPNDMLSKIAFKIPIIGSILRFLSR